MISREQENNAVLNEILAELITQSTTFRQTGKIVLRRINVLTAQIDEQQIHLRKGRPATQSILGFWRVVSYPAVHPISKKQVETVE